MTSILCLAVSKRAHAGVEVWLGNAPGRFRLVHVNSAAEFRKEAGDTGFAAGIVDARALPTGPKNLVKALRSLSSNLPLVLLVSPGDEAAALGALEQGVIADYILKTEPQVKRLPFALLAAARAAEPVASIPEDKSQYFMALLENSADAIVVVDLDGEIKFKTNAVARVLGYSVEEMAKRSIFDIIHPDDLGRIIGMFGDLAGMEGAQTSGVVRLQARDGSWHWIEARGTNLLDNPHVGGIVINYRYVNDQKQAEILQDAVYRIAQAADLAASLDELFARIHTIISEVMSAENFYIALAAPNEGFLEYPYFVDEMDPPPVGEQAENGLTEYVMQTGRSLLCDEAMQLEMVVRGEVNDVGQTSKIWLGVPLMVDGLSIGAMAVQHYENPQAYGEREMRMLEFVSSQVALVIKRKQVAEALRASEETLQDATRALQEKVAVLSALTAIDQSILAARESGELFDLVCRSAGTLLNAPKAMIVTEDAEDWKVIAAHGISGRETLTREFSDVVSLGLSREGGEFGSDSIPEDYPFMREFREREGIRAVIGESLSVGEKRIGALIAFDIQPRAWTADDAELLETLAGQAAIALEKVRLFNATQKNNRELERLYRASALLIGALSSNVGALSRQITEILVSEFRQVNCSLWLIQPDGIYLSRQAIAGSASSEFADRVIPVDGKGLVPRAVRTGEVVHARDVSDEPDYFPGWAAARSELVLPLKASNTVIGVLDFQSDHLGAFSEDDIRSLSLFASSASLMLEQARLASETELRMQRLSALHTMDVAVASSLDLNVTLKVFLEQVTSRLHVDAASVFLLKAQFNMLEYAASRGVRGSINQTSIRVGEGIAGQAALQRTVIGVPNLVSQSVQYSHPVWMTGEGIVSLYAVPLIARGQVKGVLELYFRRQFTADAEWEDFVETLSRRAAVAIDDASLFEQLQTSFTELSVAYDGTIEGWAHLLEMRGIEPVGHSHYVTSLAVELCRRMEVRVEDLVNIYRGALLHDIGMLAIPDSVIQNLDNPTEDEWAVFCAHPTYANQLLSSIEYLRRAVNIPYAHHEKWDGSGFPRGLAGEKIPIEARAFAVVDAWDTLTRGTAPRPALTDRDALADIEARSGRDFDPNVVNIFAMLVQDFREMRPLL